jgi:hypothetical protein
MSMPSDEANFAADIDPGEFEVSFSLTRLQRILNPLERLPAAILGGPFFVALLLAVVLVFAVQPATIWQRVGMLVLVLAMGAGGTLAFLPPVVSFLWALFSHNYIDTIRIGHDYLWCGCRGGQGLVLPTLKNLTVSRGVLGTVMIRNLIRGYTIVLPENVVWFATLKRVIERNREKAESLPDFPV